MESITYSISSDEDLNQDSFIKQQILKNQVEFNEGLIQERKEEIEQIYKDVFEINGIFKDLNNLVLEQGEPIVHIETNIESTAKQTEKSIKLLNDANAYHKSWLSKKNKFLLMGIAGLSINAPITILFGIKAGLISGASTIGLSAISALFTSR
jgi:syntaxin 7